MDKMHDFFIIRNLAPKSIANYNSSIKAYLTWLEKQELTPDETSYEDIRQFIKYLKFEKKFTVQTINYYISKIRFFHIYVLDKPWNQYQVPFAKFNTTLPEILTKEEALHFIDTITNLKIKAICSLMYGSGLRVSEVRHLKYSEINRKEMKIYIRESKSRSDRFVILSVQTLEILTKYWHQYNRPTDWLFPSPRSSKPISSQVIEYHLKKHCKLLNWNKSISSHIFRHSFSTHLYEDGVDLLTIQKLLGHKCIQSTTIYVHLSNVNRLGVTSPMDWR